MKQLILNIINLFGYRLLKYQPRPAIDFISKNLKGNLKGAEVGVFRGGHAKEICDFLSIKKLYLVDPYLSYEDYINGVFDNTGAREKAHNILKRKPIEFIELNSAESAELFENESLDFVYIDANHDYEFIKEDIQAWTPKVKKGGVICGHDYSIDFPGVIQAVNEEFKNFNHANNDWWVQK